MFVCFTFPKGDRVLRFDSYRVLCVLSRPCSHLIYRQPLYPDQWLFNCNLFVYHAFASVSPRLNQACGPKSKFKRTRGIKLIFNCVIDIESSLLSRSRLMNFRKRELVVASRFSQSRRYPFNAFFLCHLLFREE